jgi:hypothetical protein
MVIKLGGSLLSTTQQIQKLSEKIDESITNATPLPFDVVDGTDFINEFANFVLLKDNYKSAKDQAPVYTQERYNRNDNLLKISVNISQFLKSQNHMNKKKLEEWGIHISLNKKGEIKISGKLMELEIMYKNIIDKHIADGVNSVLAIFDMTEFESEYNELVTYRLLYEAERLSWRTISVHKRASYKKLLKMQRLISRDMITRPNVNPRDLEHWGFVVLEFHERRNTNTAA